MGVFYTNKWFLFLGQAGSWQTTNYSPAVLRRSCGSSVNVSNHSVSWRSNRKIFKAKCHFTVRNIQSVEVGERCPLSPDNTRTSHYQMRRWEIKWWEDKRDTQLLFMRHHSWLTAIFYLINHLMKLMWAYRKQPSRGMAFKHWVYFEYFNELVIRLTFGSAACWHGSIQHSCLSVCYSLWGVGNWGWTCRVSMQQSCQKGYEYCSISFVKSTIFLLWDNSLKSCLFLGRLQESCLFTQGICLSGFSLLASLVAEWVFWL